mmetsp:Transcript_9092/g.26390  ORF Transcript_9092/g.26390 Transcript_9092/m.26390 type:complete len:211 (-) Transcript_9092:230-862(-)
MQCPLTLWPLPSRPHAPLRHAPRPRPWPAAHCSTAPAAAAAGRLSWGAGRALLQSHSRYDDWCDDGCGCRRRNGAHDDAHLCLVPHVETLCLARALMELLGRKGHFRGLVLKLLQALILREHEFDVFVHDALHLVHLVTYVRHFALGAGLLHALLEGRRENPLCGQMACEGESGILHKGAEHHSGLLQEALHEPRGDGRVMDCKDGYGGV